MRIAAYILMLLMGLLVACATPNILVDTSRNTTSELDSVFVYDSAYQYHIRKDDKLTVSIWGQDDLSVGSVYGIYNSNEVYGKWLMVDEKGNIELPRLGTTMVEGLTVTDLKATLKIQYARWIKEPVIDIKVLNKEITVMGEVGAPQVIQVDKNRNTLLEVISRCGGFGFYANISQIKVLRQVGPDVHVAHLDLRGSDNYLQKNLQLHPGDIVLIPSRKSKAFDQRVSTIIPLTSTVTAAAVLMGSIQ